MHSGPSDLVVAFQLKSSRAFSPNVTIKAAEDWTLEAVVEDAKEDAFADDVEVFE